jgi:hypothetical protein
LADRGKQEGKMHLWTRKWQMTKTGENISLRGEVYSRGNLHRDTRPRDLRRGAGAYGGHRAKKNPKKYGKLIKDGDRRGRGPCEGLGGLRVEPLGQPAHDRKAEKKENG